ncbi:hypothetical protein SAMN04487968_104147 [Nocardioides terrae]|uniref:Uncharacterized protein n=1 Tax=Nocardioides terrae TaxID=574651 RepID=A0A1I1H6D2_9ACTN|nr:hypothetical protein [Nocardioides terrae]SFC17618.1 hypothetical protein SAMN04487968_104147 [Nocardioides terrae]
MLVFGLILIVLGVIALLAGLFTAGDSGHASLLGIHIGATSVFLVGVFAGVAILWGFSISKFGTKRELRQRRDQKRLRELSDKLDRVDGDRRDDDDERPGQ